MNLLQMKVMFLSVYHQGQVFSLTAHVTRPGKTDLKYYSKVCFTIKDSLVKRCFPLCFHILSVGIQMHLVDVQ